MNFRIGILATAAAGLIATTICGAPAVTAQPETHFFVSPSGNIACVMATDLVRCDIEERDWSPPTRPADCPSQTGFGQGIRVKVTGKPEFVCGGDSTFGADARTLQYGERDSSTAFLCTSETAGIRCENRDDHGFIISRESYELF